MRDWFGYWARVNEDPEAYAEYYGGADGAEEYYDEHGKEADYE